MWELKHLNTVYRILVDEQFSVGRKDCNIIISGDPSVSRRHASLHTSHPFSNVGISNAKPICLLKDDTSKYGSFVNGTKVCGEGVILNDGDVVTFGQCGSNFTVSYKPLVVTTSCVEPGSKANLKEAVCKLGGHVVEEWIFDCTHLAMTGIKLTVKTVCALISQKPIVLPDYFSRYLECCKARKEPEVEKNCMPPVTELLLHQSPTTFQIDSTRVSMFKEKTFIFLSGRQYTKLRLPISLAGGKIILMNRSRCAVTQELLLSSCVIQCPSETNGGSQTCTPTEIEDIVILLKNHNKRLIPESDIGLAIVNSSMEQYCNPSYVYDVETTSTLSSSGSLKLQSQTLTQNIICVPETEDEISLNLNPSQSQTTQKSKLVSTVLDTETESSEVSFQSKFNKDVPRFTVSSQNKKRPVESPEPHEPSLKVFKPEHSRLQDPIIKIQSLTKVKEEPGSQPFSNSLLESMNSDRQHSVFNLNIEKQQPSSSLFKEETFPELEGCRPGTSKKICEDKLDTRHSKRQKLTEIDQKVKQTENEVNTVRTEIFDSGKQTEIITEKPHTMGGKKLINVNFSVPLGFLHSKVPNKAILPKEGPEAAESLDLPSNVLVVKVVNLVHVHTSSRHFQKIDTVIDPAIKNYKNFRKTVNMGASRLPRIIGGNDLVAYTRKENCIEVNDWLHDQETDNTIPGFT